MTLRKLKALLLVGAVAYGWAIAHPEAASHNLKSECTEHLDEEGRNIRTCTATGEKPAVPGVAQPVPQQEVVPPISPPVAQEEPAIPPTLAPPSYPLPQQYPPQGDNRIRQQFRLQFGGFTFTTPPIVVGRIPTCQTQCYRRGSQQDCRQYCW